MNETTKKATRQSYGEALAKLGKENENIVVLDADLSKATKTDLFAKEFPNRFFEMGISEQDMMATVAGFATCRQNSICKHICGICSRKSI